MSILKTSITIGSTTLFPTPVNFTKNVNENINGTHNGFQSVSIPSAGSAILYTTQDSVGDSGVVYLYVASASTNTSAVNLQISDDNNGAELSFARIYPGDFVYLPLNAQDGDGLVITAVNGAGGFASSLSYFTGERD